MPHYRAPTFVTRFRFGYLLYFWLLAFVLVTRFCFGYWLSFWLLAFILVTRFRFVYLLLFWLLTFVFIYSLLFLVTHFCFWLCAFVFVTRFCFCYSLSKKHECPSLARRMLIYRRLVIPIMCLIGCIPYIYIYCILYCRQGDAEIHLGCQ